MGYGADYGSGLDSGAMLGLLGAYWLIWAGVMVFKVAVMWQIFAKAGRPGWAALVPLYNLWVYCEVCGKPGWWMFMFFVPLLNLVVGILLAFLLAERFGHGLGFAIGLVLLSLIFHAVLAFGDSRWTPPRRPVPGGGHLDPAPSPSRPPAI